MDHNQRHQIVERLVKIRLICEEIRQLNLVPPWYSDEHIIEWLMEEIRYWEKH